MRGISPPGMLAKSTSPPECRGKFPPRNAGELGQMRSADLHFCKANHRFIPQIRSQISVQTRKPRFFSPAALQRENKTVFLIFWPGRGKFTPRFENFPLGILPKSLSPPEYFPLGLPEGIETLLSISRYKPYGRDVLEHYEPV